MIFTIFHFNIHNHSALQHLLLLRDQIDRMCQVHHLPSSMGSVWLLQHCGMIPEKFMNQLLSNMCHVSCH